jgi:DNA transformation protein
VSTSPKTAWQRLSKARQEEVVNELNRILKEMLDLPIESLCNLGPKSGQWLREAGITTIAELERLGPVVAFRLVKQHQPKASLNLLWAMAAGLKGKNWRELTESPQKRLRKEAVD